MAGLLARKLAPRTPKILSVVPTIFNQPSKSATFWEPNKKSGYKHEHMPSKVTMIKDGLKEITKETKLLKEEVKDKFYADGFLDLQDGDYDYVWKLNTQEDIEDWSVTADRDNNEGKSNASLVISKNSTAIFHGYLSQEVPKDGIIKRSGYANIMAPSNFKSYKRKNVYDWSLFNCLVMRVRGDGRPYMLNILMDNYYDVSWNDQYNYTLFTRGGPYWQVAKIPFSKFYLSTKGRIQDKQEPIMLDRISTMGISVGDGVEGPFSLEIDYIGVMFDANHYETFAYEMFECTPAEVGT